MFTGWMQQRQLYFRHRLCLFEAPSGSPFISFAAVAGLHCLLAFIYTEVRSATPIAGERNKSEQRALAVECLVSEIVPVLPRKQHHVR